MIPFISNLFNLPVTRKEVLKRAKKIKKSGLCYTLRDALREYNIYSRCPGIYFSKFERKNALQFGADKFCEWWWIPYVWDTGRMDFLDWLIDQYKDNKTDLRQL